MITISVAEAFVRVRHARKAGAIIGFVAGVLASLLAYAAGRFL